MPPKPAQYNMRTYDTIIRFLVVLGCQFLLAGIATAQPMAMQARQFAAEKNYDKAINIYRDLYGMMPDSVYTEYLQVLVAARKYQPAQQLVEGHMALHADPMLRIDIGKILEAQKKPDAAKEQYGMLLKMINGDDMLTQRVAKAFVAAGKDDYALEAYETGSRLIGTTILYSGPMAELYAKTGAIDKAIDVLLANNPGQYVNLENAKTVLLSLLGTDAQKLQQAQKAIIKRINEQPENNQYAELLTWIYTQKDDWDGALIQIEALDERNAEDGRRLMQFARTATIAHQHEIAVKAYDDVIAKVPPSPNALAARTERLEALFTVLKNNPAYTPEAVTALLAQYDTLLAQAPAAYNGPAVTGYATVLAEYANDAPKAIAVLKKAIALPETRKLIAAQFRLQLADYYVLTGNIWEASLTYSQVDKEFKQDVLGEDARFRNAKLAYYRGDFDWAQRQLSVLKASTSQLIANDALYLSVLITENIEDSIKVPLQRFAYAGLLLAQNKDAATITLLDSVANAYPEHPLNDDILMLRADIAVKHRQYDTALNYLQLITTKYGEDVLGDDALLKIADIYHYKLKQPLKAKEYYERLILDFPGSTWVQTARQRLATTTATP